jgi:heme oxygenase
MTEPQLTIMQRLKVETADLHTYAERRPLQGEMLKGSIARSRYGAYLGQLMLVHRTLEATLTEHASRADLDCVFKPHQRRHDDLRTDLAFLEVDADAIEPLPATSRLIEQIQTVATDHPVALLGMLYVLEGSTNGSKFIAKGMMRTHNMQPGPGLRYLDPYGDAQMKHWQAFKADMDAMELNEQQADAIVDAAKHMFQAIADISDEVHEPVATA